MIVRVIPFVVVGAFAACSSDPGTPIESSSPDASTTSSSTTDPGGESADSSTSTSTSTDSGTSADSGSSGKKKNAEVGCSADSDCESNHCFSGNNQSFCTVPCTDANKATVCVAPFTGSCNKQGFCKRD